MINKMSCKNLDEQGYSFLSTKEKNELNIALRVTPVVCIILVFFGFLYQSVIIFSILSIFAFLGVVTRRWQPVDALYNFLAYLTKWQKLPPSTLQKRVACAVGMFFLLGATVSIYFGSVLWMYVFGVSYIVAAGLMALTHFCIASWLYNRIS